jgi:hypothetical protein
MSPQSTQNGPHEKLIASVPIRPKQTLTLCVAFEFNHNLDINHRAEFARQDPQASYDFA